MSKARDHYRSARDKLSGLQQEEVEPNIFDEEDDEE